MSTWQAVMWIISLIGLWHKGHQQGKYNLEVHIPDSIFLLLRFQSRRMISCGCTNCFTQSLTEVPLKVRLSMKFPKELTYLNNNFELQMMKQVQVQLPDTRHRCYHREQNFVWHQDSYSSNRPCTFSTTGSPISTPSHSPLPRTPTTSTPVHSKQSSSSVLNNPYIIVDKPSQVIGMASSSAASTGTHLLLCVKVLLEIGSGPATKSRNSVWAAHIGYKNDCEDCSL